MKSYTTYIILLGLFTSIIYGQNPDKSWEKFNFLIGNWTGEGTGKPGEGSGSFSFQLDLNNKVLVRKSHSEYPASKDKPLIIHDDLMIIYLSTSGQPEKAIYFDNEGHVINYTLSFPDENDVVFTSDKITGNPVFKLTYSKIENDLLNTKFEMSRDGVNFMTYIEGKSKRERQIH